MAEDWGNITLFAPSYWGPRTFQKTSVFFLEVILQHLFKPRQARYNGRHEARRTIRFE